MIVVHHLNNSRSQRVLWLLEELGLPYEVRRYERNPATMLAPPELKAVHPLGKSPALDDGEVRVAETGAIIEYLLDAYDLEGRLRPARGTAYGRRFTYWLHYAEGSAMPPLLLKLVFSQLPKRAPGLVRPLVNGVAAKAQAGFIDPQLKTHADWQEKELAATGWFAGPDFSAADIMMSFPLEAAASRAVDLAAYPNIARFLQTIHARPAWKRALERGGDYAYA
ncbi:glutathione S-transferase [Brevundimonas pondensis]|uniref:Glutathione S-transferase n=1 Tax=Brevundimonas pondensis TaxID=2774189 RepID=A0ABX7SHL3_9CAUL|nr:glutathione S-transferase [Brevundimonas pondensis]QTC87154.1 glutathione S-transferase [Brevundimonas pondensis]